MTSNEVQPVIEIQGLTKDFKVGFMVRGEKEQRQGFFSRTTVRALDNLSLDVRRGESFGFLGPNGAGKTTTLKLLMGLTFPTSGSARILGNPIDDVLTRKRLGYLPENPYFYDYLTGRELLFYTASLFGISRGVAVGRVNQMLDTVGLDQKAADRQLRKYSKGMTQRIGIAQALINDPDVVFLDEPMSGLDPIGRREVRDLLLDLRARSKTVFFSSHILSDVEALCDRVAILNRGKLYKSGTLAELTAAQSSFEVVGLGTDNTVLENLTAGLEWIESFAGTPNGAHIRVKSESNVEQAIALIRQTGGKLVSVNPSKASLEHVFFSAGNKPLKAENENSDEGTLQRKSGT
ncbi:MAG TPA: ABC transporter ATP-binding protein [Blastocatellia bacterium]